MEKNKINRVFALLRELCPLNKNKRDFLRSTREGDHFGCAKMITDRRQVGVLSTNRQAGRKQQQQ